MWYLLAGIGWIWLRRRQGKPILPDFVARLIGTGGHPFENGATLIPTPKGIVAIPADTPVMHPAAAASSGLLQEGATMNLAQALQRAKIDMTASSSLTSGAWAMFDPHAGAGPDVFVDELGMPRSNSKISRRWGVR